MNQIIILKKFLEKDEDAKESATSIIHVDVPRESVAHLIGRDGMNIRQIEEETCTSISFIDSGEMQNKTNSLHRY